ncbi:E3 ubiquitin-protein ligase HERC2 [Malaya genurostris]|uniref:E3 ubiquitin-protein ligase HERC2 n=1 Tax=Malaya genurostris TaxID=325434 RepID=UPI0026F3D823|nr:E3 ubiquitin-protein ligase HERC2 [Malaya genurostris]
MDIKTSGSLPDAWIIGFNPFNLKTNGSLTELNLNTILKSTASTSLTQTCLIEITSTHALVTYGCNLYSHSAIVESTHETEFNSPIVKLSASTWHCLVLLENGDLFKYDINQHRSRRLDFLTVENRAESTDPDRIVHIACGDCLSVASTRGGEVFTIPNKTFTFPRHVRIVKLVAGLEHCLLLTGNGDVYSWGGGLRGQLGNGEIKPHQEQPKLIEALAGLKIVDIAAGGWHSGAISAFGDLFCWGWNSKGQLGQIDEQQQKASVFSLPQLVEISDGDGEDVSFEQVYCGMCHTVAIDSKGLLYFAGSNLSTRLDFTKIQRCPKLGGFERFENGLDREKKFKLKCGANSIILVQES